jgi:hypothetical protein
MSGPTIRTIVIPIPDMSEEEKLAADLLRRSRELVILSEQDNQRAASLGTEIQSVWDTVRNRERDFLREISKYQSDMKSRSAFLYDQFAAAKAIAEQRRSAYGLTGNPQA